MKQSKITLLIFLLFCLYVTAKAQYTNLHSSDVNVAGLSIGSRYTAAQVEEAMGCKPVRGFQWKDEFGLAEEYEYDNAILRFVENGVLAEFSITTSLYPVFQQYHCGIRVGSPIVKLTQMSLSSWLLIPHSNEEYHFVKNGKTMIFEVNDFKRITRISYRYALFD